MLDFIYQHLAEILFSLGALLLVLELAFLGVSGPVLFIALGCFWSGLLVQLGVITSPLSAAVVAASAAMTAAIILWKPLKKWQNKTQTVQTTSDMVGKTLPVTAPVTALEGRVSYSGIEWLAALAADETQPLAVGEQAVVVAVDGTLLRVKAVAAKP